MKHLWSLEHVCKVTVAGLLGELQKITLGPRTFTVWLHESLAKVQMDKQKHNNDSAEL